MHFQEPELLYALFLLIIPLIVHLFRLRKFQKQDFTNVKFLKKVIQETRKSSRLKKILILITRLCLLACLILAFAQPFIPASDKALSETKRLIYFDNSFSMQAGNGQTSNFQKAVNSLQEKLEAENEFALFTNTNEYYDLTAGELKEEVQNITLSEKQITFREIGLKANNYFKKFPLAEKDLVIISDFQDHSDDPEILDQEKYNIHLIQPDITELNNVNLDTAFIENATPENINLKIRASSTKKSEEPISISVYNGSTLLGRNTFRFLDDNSEEISFRLQNDKITDGRIEIEDNGLKYDDKLYFNISENPEIKVIIITADESDYLERIFTQPEFQLLKFQPDQIDFNKLNSANLIVLNEIDQVPSSLKNNLSAAKNNGASIIIIPSEDIQGYTQILNTFGFPAFTKKVTTERLITRILFDHPLFDNVFEKEIENFEYPKVLNSYNLGSANSILSYQDNQAFLAESNSVYVFTAALNHENSNFQNSPLIVPVFYQIGLTALKKNQLFYLTNRDDKIDIPAKLGQDQVLHIKNTVTDLIPQQQHYGNRTTIHTGNVELIAGNYEITSDKSVLGHISFNYSRTESNERFQDPTTYPKAKIYSTVDEYFQQINAATQITSLWKWFVIFALIFLAIEMLLIKFFK